MNNYAVDDSGREMNPEEIKRQATRIMEQAEAFKSSCNKMIDILSNKIVPLVKSEDSELSSTIESYANTYIELHANSYKKFQKLADKMNAWADGTIKIENLAAEEIANLSSGLEDLTALIDALK